MGQTVGLGGEAGFVFLILGTKKPAKQRTMGKKIVLVLKAEIFI